MRNTSSERSFVGSILALAGPSGVGKSTVRRLLTATWGNLIVPVPILTTRPPEHGDDGEYQYVDIPTFKQLIRDEKIIASTCLHTGSEVQWYGYRASDIAAVWRKGLVPVVIAELQLLRGLSAHFGRRRLLSFALLPPGGTGVARTERLAERLRSRGYKREDIDRRLLRSEEDLRTFEEQRDLFNHLVVNDHLPLVLNTLIAHVRALPRVASRI